MSELPVMLTVDTGLSGTKNIWRVNPISSELLLMSPEVIEVTSKAIDFYKTRRITVPEPENEAWVEYGGNLYAVGHLAQNHFDARVVLSDLKYEWAIAKVLGAVGVMAMKERLPEKFELALALLLPYSEWEAREKFARGIKKALSNFSFCEQKFSVSVSLFICVPEGGGHALARGEKIGSAFSSRKIVSIMLGYRDVSVVLFEKGVIQGKTERLGMSKMLQMIQSRTLDQTTREREQRLLSTIHKVGRDIKPKNFLPLALSQNPENRLEEAAQISEAVKYASGEYWKLISKFICNHLPFDIEEVILGGGTLDYFRSQLTKLMAQNYKNAYISIAADLEEDVRITFNLHPENKSLCARLTDAYALSNFLWRQTCLIPEKASAKRSLEK